MFQEWIKELQKEENQFLITELSQRYCLSKEEYLNLVDLMIYYYIITTSPNTIQTVPIICDEIMRHKEEINKNQNYSLFRSCLTILLEQEKKKEGNLNKLDAFLEEGFVFHSFNSAFNSQIEEKGLIVKEKPWSLEEVEQVREIFKKYQKDIFGTYQGRTSTPIFFANNLISSAYYGLSSPTFFRKFIENHPQYFNTFLNRDYVRAKESMERLCSSLTYEETEVVMGFFQKYWNMLATDSLPSLAISTKKKLGIATSQNPPSKKDIDFYLHALIDSNNVMKRENIERDQLEILSYQSLSFAPVTKEKYIV